MFGNASPLSSTNIVSVLPPNFFRLKYIHVAINGHHDDQAEIRLFPTILTIVTMHLSVVLATIPCAKPFFVVFQAGVFRSPHEPKTPTRQSFETGAEQATEVVNAGTSDHSGEGQPAERPLRPVLTWNRRASFAKPAEPEPSPPPEESDLPPLPPRSIFRFAFMNPFAWSRGKHPSKRVSIHTPLPLWKTSHREESSASASHSTSTPFSYLSSTFTRASQGQNSNSSNNRPVPPSASTSNSQASGTPTSNVSQIRRQSDYFDSLRPKDGKTETAIRHDPVHAEVVARKRATLCDDPNDTRRMGIELTHSFEVTYEDAPVPPHGLKSSEEEDQEPTPRPSPPPVTAAPPSTSTRTTPSQAPGATQ